MATPAAAAIVTLTTIDVVDPLVARRAGAVQWFATEGHESQREEHADTEQQAGDDVSDVVLAPVDTRERDPRREGDGDDPGDGAQHDVRGQRRHNQCEAAV